MLKVRKNTLKSQRIAALSIVAKIWNQPICPTTDKCIMKMHIHTMECYTAMVNDEVLQFAAIEI